MSDKKAVILLSGGLDSATVVALAKADGYSCYTMSFDYGQRHRSELQAAEQVARQLGVVEHKVVGLNLNGIGGSALTDASIEVPESPSEGIPVTYVPARNTVFLSLALGWAEVLGARDIFIGVNAVDYSGYPDCRPEYLTAFQKLADLASKSGLEGHGAQLWAPLVQWSKTEITCAGDGKIVVKVNGKLISEGETVLTSGPIGFQSEGSEIHFRNMHIKQLP